MIALTDKLAWYVARSSGIVAWATITASILWGLTLSSRLVRKRGVPAWLLDLHRYLGTLSVVFVAIHLGGLVADNFVYFGWRELFIPMKSPCLRCARSPNARRCNRRRSCGCRSNWVSPAGTNCAICSWRASAPAPNL